MGVCDKTVLGVVYESESRTFGVAKQLINLDAATGDLIGEVTILKPEDGNMDVPPGTTELR